MATYGYSTLAGLLKIVYDTEKMRSLLAENFQLEGFFQKFDGPPTPDAKGGLYWEFAVLTQWPSSAGWMAFSGTTRTPQTANLTTGRVYQRQLAATTQLEKAMMTLAKTNVQAFQNVVQLSRESLLLRIRDMRIKAYLGSNSGTLARVNGNHVAQTVINVEGMLNYTKGDGTYIAEGAEVFKVGDQIALDAAAATGGPFYRTVTAVSTTNGTITVNLAVDVSDGEIITYGESGTNLDFLQSMNGLNDLYNATAAYENIDPAATALWAPQVFNGSTAGTEEPMGSTHINRLITKPQINAGADIDIIASNSNMIQSFMDLFESQIRYEPGSFKGGMQIVDWDLLGKKVKLVFDPQLPHHNLFGIPSKDCMKFVALDGEWLDEDGAEYKWVVNTTQFINVWCEIKNFGTRFRNHFAIQKDIEEPWA